MEKLVLNYIADDHLGFSVYEDCDGNLLKDIDYGCAGLNLHTISEIDDDPCTDIQKISRYKNREIVIKGREQNSKNGFNYQMLGRLKSDCDSFIYYEGRNGSRLWAKNPTDQILEMKKIYNELPDDEKPEWLTMGDILEYEKTMTEKIKRRKI